MHINESVVMQEIRLMRLSGNAIEVADQSTYHIEKKANGMEKQSEDQDQY